MKQGVKQILAFLVLVALIVAVPGVVAVQAAPFEELLGPVKAVERWGYEVEMKFGEPTEQEESHKLTNYDRHGNSVQTICYATSGRITEQYKRAFDENDRMTQEEKLDPLGNLVLRVIIDFM